MYTFLSEIQFSQSSLHTHCCMTWKYKERAIPKLCPGFVLLSESTGNNGVSHAVDSKSSAGPGMQEELTWNSYYLMLVLQRINLLNENHHIQSEYEHLQKLKIMGSLAYYSVNWTLHPWFQLTLNFILIPVSLTIKCIFPAYYHSLSLYKILKFTQNFIMKNFRLRKVEVFQMNITDPKLCFCFAVLLDLCL